MSRQPDPSFDQQIADWLEDDPDRAPSAVLQTVLAAYPSIPQRRTRRIPWRFPTLNRMALVAAAAVIVLLAVVVVLIPRGGGGPGGPIPSPSPTNGLPTSSPAALGAEGTSALPGTYAPQFEPAFNFTIDPDIVDATDCGFVGVLRTFGEVQNATLEPGLPGPTFDCRFTIDVNRAESLQMGFGTAHGFGIEVHRLDKVVDPPPICRQSCFGASEPPLNLIDPPADLVAWVQSVAGKTPSGGAVLEPPKAVLIGGLAATQFDVSTNGGSAYFGPSSPTSLGARLQSDALRVVVLRVHEHVVLIIEKISWNNTAYTTGHFAPLIDGQAALNSLQPLIDSIDWQ